MSQKKFYCFFYSEYWITVFDYGDSFFSDESRADNIVDAFVPNDHAEGYKALCKQAYKDPVHVSKLPAVTEMKKTGYLESSTAVQFLLLVGACLFIQFFHALMVKV